MICPNSSTRKQSTFWIGFTWPCGSLHLLNLAQGQPPPEPSALADMRAWSLDLIDRAKWALWNGQSWKTQAYLEDLCGWCHARRPETPRSLVQLGKAAQELWAYLETNRDSLPNYGKRYRAGLPIAGGLHRVGRQRGGGQAQ